MKWEFMFRLGRGFRRWIYLTQTHQALAYDTAVRHWRRIKHQPDARTMGVQLTCAVRL